MSNSQTPRAGSPAGLGTAGPGSAGPGAAAPPPQQVVMQMMIGKWITQGLAVAAELGIADQLKSGPLPVDTLASACGAHPGSLYRLLRALAAVGVFAELPERRFAQTPLSDTLRADAPGSTRNMAIWLGERACWQAWSELGYSIRTGQPAWDKVHGKSAFEFMSDPAHATSAAIFNNAMTGMSAATGQAVVEAYDFSGIGTLVDVGGGHGMLLSTILARYPAMRGVLFDLPPVVAGAGPVLAAMGQQDRIQTIGGSFLEGVPPGGDAYIMKAIIHDWHDEACLKLLSHCRQGMKPGGKVLIVDAVLNDGPESTFPKWLDLEMLVVVTGRERTADEFAALLARAGLRLARIVPTQSLVSVIEGVAA